MTLYEAFKKHALEQFSNGALRVYTRDAQITIHEMWGIDTTKGLRSVVLRFIREYPQYEKCLDVRRPVRQRAARTTVMTMHHLRAAVRWTRTNEREVKKIIMFYESLGERYSLSKALHLLNLQLDARMIAGIARVVRRRRPDLAPLIPIKRSRRIALATQEVLT